MTFSGFDEDETYMAKKNLIQNFNQNLFQSFIFFFNCMNLFKKSKSKPTIQATAKGSGRAKTRPQKDNNKQEKNRAEQNTAAPRHPKSLSIYLNP